MGKRREVENWLKNYDNPMRKVVMAVRNVILQANSKLDESIKRQAPTFVFEGNLATFNPRCKRHVSLMFHDGASLSGKHLEGDGKQARIMKFYDLDDVEKKRTELERIVNAWVARQEGVVDAKRSGLSSKSRRKTSRKKKTSKVGKSSTRAKAGTARKKSAPKKAPAAASAQGTGGRQGSGAEGKSKASKEAASKRKSQKKTTPRKKPALSKKKPASKKAATRLARKPATAKVSRKSATKKATKKPVAQTAGKKTSKR